MTARLPTAPAPSRQACETPFVTSGIRVGTPAVTSRGFKEAEMLKIAQWMKDIATDFEGNRERVSAEVVALCEKFPIYD